MASTAPPIVPPALDAEALAARIAEAVAGHTDAEVAVAAVTPLVGGACQDNLRVDLTIDGAPRRLVVRSDAASALPGSLGRADELAVIDAAVRAGVRTPAARWLTRGLLRPDADAYFMDFVAGETIARKVLRAAPLAAARARLPAQLAEELARIHAVDIEALPAHLRPPGDPIDRALASHRAALDVLPEPRPVLELALRWLERHRPATVERALCHGDFRTGNFAVDADGLVAVLDWEFAHVGDPVDDLGWLCVRDWRFGNLDRPFGGIATRAELLALYAQASGRIVDRPRLHYWELMGNVRWCIGAICQGERYLSGAESDLELIAIGQRVPELEWEILRLIDTAP